MADTLENQINEFCNTLNSINRVYEDFSKSVNIPYTTLEILDVIIKKENCTQKAICEHTFLPKQTVNNVITSFYRNGIVELKELQWDRRNKTVHLTEKGKEFADNLMPKVRNAEYKAMKNLSAEQRDNLLKGIKDYYEMFKKAMDDNIAEK